MTPEELATRARQYCIQALDRATVIESRGGVPEPAQGDWVSLKANLVSAKADLDTLVGGA